MVLLAAFAEALGCLLEAAGAEAGAGAVPLFPLAALGALGVGGCAGFFKIPVGAGAAGFEFSCAAL